MRQFLVFLCLCLGSAPLAAAETHQLRFAPELYALFLRADFEFASTVGGLCLLGGGGQAADRFIESGLTSQRADPVELCTTMYTALIERGSLPSLLDQKQPPDTRAFDFAVGFQSGFAAPERYDRYRAVPDAHLQHITDECGANRGSKADCTIAGALQGVRIQTYFTEQARR